LLGLLIIFSFPLIFMVAITYYRLSTFYLFFLLMIALAGEELFYQAELTNHGKKVLASALIFDDAPERIPTRDEFINSVEPGEELRNVADRFLKYYRWLWLVKRKSTYRSSPVVLPEIQAGESKMVSMSCVPLKRGKITFPDTKLVLPDPLGIFQKIVKLAPDTASVTVLPKRYTLPELDLEGVSRNQMGGRSVARATGQTEEVVGLREYRPGDPPKHIHWRSWAKTGKPIVREYEDVFFPRYGLVLDTTCAYERMDYFEEAVSIATFRL